MTFVQDAIEVLQLDANVPVNVKMMGNMSIVHNFSTELHFKMTQTIALN